MKRIGWMIFIALSLLSGMQCQNALHIKDFDQQIWIKERNQCKGKGDELFYALEKEKDKLKGAYKSDIVKLLGKPDISNLLKRNKVDYVYLINEDCEEAKDKKKISIRFNALGRASELTFER